MGERLEFTVLDVGQGTGTFLAVHDDRGEVVRTVLIDLGSERAKLAAGGPSAEYVVEKLWYMAPPRLDAVVLSHSDSDHINLVQDVLSQFAPPDQDDPDKPNLTVGFLAYGGDRGKYRKGKRKNVVALVEEYMDSDDQATAFAASSSDFTASPVAPFFNEGGLRLYLVIGNAAQPDGKAPKSKKRKISPSFAINTNSLVVLVEYRGVQFVATGDATGPTLAACNTVITDSVRKTYFKDVFMLAMPHHGSARTTFSLQGLSPDVTPEDNLTKFVERIPAQTITASAERVPTFKHPSARVLSYFWDKLTAPAPFYSDPLLSASRHFYTAYFTKKDGFTLDDGSGKTSTWPKSDRWYTVQSARNVYTNLYFGRFLQSGVDIPPSPAKPVTEYNGQQRPPLGVAWLYKVDETSRVLERVVNRPNLLEWRRRIVAARDEPDELPHWWGALDVTSTDPADLPALGGAFTRQGWRPRPPGATTRRVPPPVTAPPPHAAAAPPGLARVRVIR